MTTITDDGVPFGAARERRFWAKVEVDLRPNACWPWKASRNKGGYGTFGVAAGQSRLAHRIAYRLLVGPIPPGLEPDHTCRSPGCANPAHLDLVTHRENVVRGFDARLGGMCAAGLHPLPAGRGGRRTCAPCQRIMQATNRARRLAEGRFVHGTMDGYNVGCRCVPCCDGMRTYKRDWQRRASAG